MGDSTCALANAHGGNLAVFCPAGSGGTPGGLPLAVDPSANDPASAHVPARLDARTRQRASYALGLVGEIRGTHWGTRPQKRFSRLRALGIPSATRTAGGPGFTVGWRLPDPVKGPASGPDGEQSLHGLPRLSRFHASAFQVHDARLPGGGPGGRLRSGCVRSGGGEPSPDGQGPHGGSCRRRSGSRSVPGAAVAGEGSGRVSAPMSTLMSGMMSTRLSVPGPVAAGPRLETQPARTGNTPAPHDPRHVDSRSRQPFGGGFPSGSGWRVRTDRRASRLARSIIV